MHQRPLYNKEEVLKIAKQGFVQNGPKLPTPPMLMFDRIIAIKDDAGHYEKGYLEAELDIVKDAWFFQCHFIGDPVMPGCLGMDALWQLAGLYLGQSKRIGKGRALGCGSVSFKGEVTPDKKCVTYKIHIEKIMKRPNQILIYADGELWCDGDLLYEIKRLKVGLFSQ